MCVPTLQGRPGLRHARRLAPHLAHQVLETQHKLEREVHRDGVVPPLPQSLQTVLLDVGHGLEQGALHTRLAPCMHPYRVLHRAKVIGTRQMHGENDHTTLPHFATRGKAPPHPK